MSNFFSKKITFLFFLKQRWHLIILLSSLMLNLITWLWLWWRVKSTEELIPLSYNIYFGIDFLGDWWQIFLGPIFGLLVILINYFLAYFIFLVNKFISHWLIVLTLIIQIFILVYDMILVINYY